MQSLESLAVADETETVRAMLAAFERRDVDGALAYVHPEVELRPYATQGMAGRDGHYRGHDGIREYFADVAKVWHELVVIAEDYRAAAGSVVVFGRVRGYNDETTVDSPVIWVWKLRDGLVCSGQVFPTPAAALASVEPAGGDA